MDIIRNTDRNRFELQHAAATIGTLEYSHHRDAIVLERIEVDDVYSGRGLAASFTEAVLEEIQQDGQRVIPKCPYVRGYMLKHPRWRKVARDVRMSA